VERKDTFYAYAIGHLADGERPSGTTPLEADDDPFESLYPFSIPLNNADLNADGVTRAKLR
jgi:hypothetical protein